MSRLSAFFTGRINSKRFAHNQEMKEMKKLLLIIATLTLSVSVAGAGVLWDQSAIDPSGNSYMDSYSIGPWGDVIVYGASDFNLDVDATITSVTTYYSANGEWAEGTYDALLDIYEKTGPTPVTGVDDPLTTGTTISVTLTDMGDGSMALNASGLHIDLAAGQYWIMMSPTVPDGPGFREFHLAAETTVLDYSAWIEFGGWLPGSWTPQTMDGTLLIEGDFVVPNESVSFGGVKSLYR
jgi:hypothetical protein